MKQTGKLVTVIPKLTEAQRNKIRDACAEAGYTAFFFPDTESAVQAVPDAKIVFTAGPELIERMPQLKWQCTTNAGVNAFASIEAVRSGRVLLTNSSGAYGVTIAEHIVMVLLEVLRRQSEYREIVSKKEWTRNLPVRSIHGSTIVLFGTGDIGQTALRRLRAFEPKQIIGVNRSGTNPEHLFDRVLTNEELDHVLPNADILILALPATKQTVHILNKERISSLKDGAVIVNVGRGSTIDQAALFEQLKQQRLYAALDVFEQEPIPHDDPLWDCPNLLITPHVAGDTSLPYTVERIVELFLEDFAHYVRQEPMERLIDITRGY